MPVWRKVLGLCFSVPLVVGGVALLVDVMTAERYLHGRYCGRSSSLSASV
jgi:hypothetical protein